MIKFSYEVKGKFIWWKASWDGKHNEKWYTSDENTPHPFSQDIDSDVEENKLQDVVANNPVTRAMCKMLLDKKNLHKHSGNVDQYYYWMSLLGTLARLWD